MAETYKGLTIRIGGDATNLQKALRSTESAITRTQTQLRKMSQALRMDPGSTSAINKQLDLMGNSAVETQKKVLQLQRAIERAGGEKIELFGGKETTKTVSQLAEETSDVSRRAAEAADNYSVLNGQIESLYASINKAARASENFGKKYDIRNYRDDLESQFAKMGDLGIDDVINDLRKLRPAWEDAFNENEIAKAIEKLRDTDSELIKTQASAKKAAETFAEMSLSAQRMSISPDIDKELSGIRRSSEVLSDSLDRAQRALKLDPSNANAAVMAMQRLDDAANLAEQEITLLQKRLFMLEGRGAADTARSVSNISDEARRAAESFTDATKRLTDMRAEITRCEDGMRKLELAGKTNGDEYTDLENSVREARVEVERLEQAQADAFNTAKRYDLASQYEDAKLRVTELTSQVNSYRKAQSEITAPKSFLSSTTMMDLGMTLSTSVTPAIIGMGYAAIQSAQDIDSAYRDMRKTVNGSEDDFEALRQAAIDFSTTHVTSADQILSIQAIGGELGVAVEDLETFATTVSNLEIATDLDADEAATSLGQLSNIMNDLSGEKMPAFSDALVRLGNNGASTESQIVDIAARIGSMSSIIGMSTPEVLAWASTIASTGQGAEAAGTAIANTMSDIEQAVAGGGDSLEAFAQVSQMSADDFARAWESDPSSAMKAFIEGLNKIEDDGGSATGTLSALGITAARQVQAIEGLMQTVGMLDDNLQMSEDAWNGVSDQWGEAGDAANEAAKKAEGFSGSVQRLMNMAQVLGAEMGESLAPVIDFIADALGGLTQVFSSAPDSVKLFTSAILGLVAAAGPALMWIRAIGDAAKDIKSWGKSANAVSDVAGAVGKVADASGDVATAAAGATSSIGGLKAGLIGLGVTVAAVGVMALVDHFRQIEEEARLAERASTGLAEACGVATNKMDDESDSASDLSDKVAEVAEESDNSTQRLADLADKFDELNQTTGVTMSRLDSARSAVMLYAGQTDLTSAELGKLTSAIEYLNSTCGTNYSIVRDSGGAYQIMSDGAQVAKDSIYQLIEAKRQEALMSAQTEKLEDLYTERATQADSYTEALNAQADAQERYNKAKAEYDEAASSGADDMRLLELNFELSEARSELESTNESVSELETNMSNTDSAINKVESTLGNMQEAASGAVKGFDALVKSSSGVNAAFGGDSLQMDGFAEALEESGYSLEYFSSLSDSELQKIATSYANGSGTITEILQQLGLDAVTASQQVTDALMAFDNGTFANAITMAGININELSTAFSMAGISAEQLNAIGSTNLAALAANCNGSISQMIFMIQHYNDVPIYNKDGSITIEQTSLVDAEGNVYTWNGTEVVDKTGTVVTDYVELRDAYDNVIVWNGTELVPKETNIKCDRQQLIEGISTIDSFKRLDGTTVTTYIDTVYRVFHESKGGGGSTSLSGALQGERSIAPASASVASAMPKTMSSISLLSEGQRAVTSVTNRLRDAVAPLAARASDVAGRVSVVVEQNSVAGAARSIGSRLSRTPPYPGSGTRESQADRAVNVTIDGIGTTARVQSIALNLLDELERVGAI